MCRCDSVEKLRHKCNFLEQEISDAVNFKEFYQFTFNYARNPGQKGLGKGCQHLSLAPVPEPIIASRLMHCAHSCCSCIGELTDMFVR